MLRQNTRSDCLIIVPQLKNVAKYQLKLQVLINILSWPTQTPNYECIIILWRRIKLGNRHNHTELPISEVIDMQMKPYP